MATRTKEDRRLRLLSAVCLSLPEAERTECGAHADFRVRGKIFAYFLRNHGGDGITAACFKSRLGEHVEHVKRAPDRFYLPRFLGRRGWCGLRLDQGEIDWDEVRTLAQVSYNLAAPKELRAAPEPVANALTGQSLVRGSPAALMNLERATAARVVQVHNESPQALRPAAMPDVAVVGMGGGLRGRR